MKKPSDISPLRTQVIDALRRARQTPPGPYRNDLRQIAIGLMGLERRRRDAGIPETDGRASVAEQPGLSIAE